MNKTHKVMIKPKGDVIEIDSSKNLLEGLVSCGVYIKSTCGGHATCSDCIVKVVAGEDYLSPPPFVELKLLGNVFHLTKERLACQTYLLGDITIDISKHDKVSDEEKLKTKTSKFLKNKKLMGSIKLRKETEVFKKKIENQKEAALAFEKNKESDQGFMNHWEKKTEKDVPRKLAGGKRPKFFDTDKVDYDKKDFTREIPDSKKDSKKKDKTEKTESNPKNFKKFRE